MGYRIVYGGKFPPFGNENSKRRLYGMAVGCFLTFLALTLQFWPEGRTKIEELFLPGDPAVTKQAFSVMAQQLQSGETISDAVAAFCQEVLDGAKDTP